MEQDGESQATAEIMAGADKHSTSVNGFGAETSPSALPNAAVLIGAALVGGLVLAQLVRRIRG
jgi:hypothetical protein